MRHPAPVPRRAPRESSADNEDRCALLARPGIPRRLVWVVAFLVAASAFAAVVLYTYVNVGPLAGLPNMYEPSWGPPGKLVSAIAEGAGALLALGGLGWAMYPTSRR